MKPTKEDLRERLDLWQSERPWYRDAEGHVRRPEKDEQFFQAINRLIDKYGDEEESKPERYRCEGCGAEFDEKRFSHGRAVMGKDGNPVEVECGPINKVGDEEESCEK